MLRRFLHYAGQRYGLRRELMGVQDHRPRRGRVKTFSVVGGLFLMVCTQMGSLNAVEEALRGAAGPCRWHQWLGGKLPSADRLGEVAALVDEDALRELLRRHYHKRRRKKTLRPFADGRFVLILDGHECYASYRRRCPQCLEREIKYKKEKRTQYYHRYVLAYLLGANGSVLLDLEMQRPKEGEIAAARRLVKRLLEHCPRAFHVVAGDALYLHPQLCREVVRAGKDFIAVLKNENRDLIQDFYGLREKAPVKVIKYRGHRCECRDIEGFTSWTQFKGSVRVVSSEEAGSVRRQSTRERETTPSTWLWATSLSRTQMNTATILRLGHHRWDIENYAFNELATYWHADHLYHHHLAAMTVILLILLLAYNLFHVWHDRGLKPALRDRHCVHFFRRLLQASFLDALHLTTDRAPP